MRVRGRSIPLGAVECAVSVGIATGAAALLDAADVGDLGVVYLLAVLFVAVRRGEVPALATALVSVLALNYLFIEPRHQFNISSGENVVALAVFFIAAIVVGRLASSARQRADEAEQRAQIAAARERESEMLAGAASAVLAGAGVEAQLANLGTSVGSSAGASGGRVGLSSAPSPREDEYALRLPTSERPAWLYVTRDAGWREPDLDRIAEPLAKLIDVALQHGRVRDQAAEAEATRRADVAKTAVLHAISHDLRSPLTGITTAASGLRDDQLSRSDRDDLISVIGSEAARLARMVDDVLDLSRIQAGAVNPQTDWCDLRDILASSVAQARLAHSDATVENSLPSDLPFVQADPAQLGRVFANLIENAIKFSPEGMPVQVSGGTGGGSVTVRITDQGRGIPRAQRTKIFEPFFQGNRRPESGSGLGLAICRGFVEANGGRIVLQTGTGQGTSFAVSFPLVSQPVTA